MKKLCPTIHLGLTLVVMLLANGCMRWDYGYGDESLHLDGQGLFIVNEGNFQYGNATLSYYNPGTDSVQNEVFIRANGMKLGDVAHSMTVYDHKGWICVNNSHVIFAVDVESGRELGRIENLTSPRYIHFVSPEKAYVTQLWDNRIAIVNPSAYSITGYIDVPDMTMESGSTEQMVSYGDYVFCNCWSYQNRILKIDTRTDSIVDVLSVGLQPRSMAIDGKSRLWVITDGGYEGSPYGYEAPSLYCINAENFAVERMFGFALGDTPGEILISNDGNWLYWINGAVWCMNIDDTALPAEPLIMDRGTRYYSLTVSPYDYDIYVADAVDYQQPGRIYRYKPTGEPVSEFYVGVTPGAFCWK